MSVSQRSLSLPVVPLLTGSIPWPTRTTPSIPILSPNLNHLDHSFKFENIKQTPHETTMAQCSVPMLKRPSDEAGPSHCCAELANLAPLPLPAN